MSNTVNIALSTPAHGANVDTWDQDPVNGNATVLDACLGGVLSLTATSTTLGNTNAQNSIIKFTGTIAANVTCTISGIIKTWTVINNTSGNFNLIFSTGGGNAIGIPPGDPTDIFSDGTSFYHKNLGAVATYKDFATADTPGWVSACTVPPFLKCNGSSFNGATYPLLAAALGTTTLPDARGRSRFALNDGTSRITVSSGIGIDGNTRFAAGGSNILVQANIPNYDLATITPQFNHNIVTYDTGGIGSVASPGGLGFNFASAIAFTVSSGGSGLPALPPGYVGGIVMIRAA